VTRVLGVDGCRNGWVAVSLSDGVFTSAFFTPDLGRVTRESVDVIAVDMPIGLPAVGPRPADEAARIFVGPRRSSVFMTPAESVLRCETFPEANAKARSLNGKGLTQQAFALRKRIFEVAKAVASGSRIIEVHRRSPSVRSAAIPSSGQRRPGMGRCSGGNSCRPLALTCPSASFRI
jgi:predicted RNase H-like nuclease